MGASSSGLLDDAKVCSLKGLVESRVQVFSGFYQQQHSAAHSRHLHQEVEPNAEGRSLLLNQAPPSSQQEVLFQAAVRFSCWEEVRRSRERFIVLRRRSYSVEVYDNMEAFSRGGGAALLLLTAGGHAFTTEEESRLLLEENCAAVLSGVKDDSSSLVSSPDAPAVFLLLPYMGVSCFLFHQEEERDHFLSALKTCIRHSNLDSWCEPSYENAAFVRALRLYRQDGGRYECWEKLLGTEEQVLASQLMEEVLPWLQSQIQSRLKNKKTERIRQWLAAVRESYLLVLDQVSSGLEVLKGACRQTASSNQSLIRSDLDQILASRCFLEDKVRACVCAEARGAFRDLVVVHVSSVLDAVTRSIASETQRMKNSLTENHANGGTVSSPLSLDQVYRPVEDLDLEDLDPGFVRRLTQRVHLEMEKLMANAVFTFQTFLQSSPRPETRVPVQTQRVKERVLKQLDYDSRLVQMNLVHEALLEISLPVLIRTLDKTKELQQLEQHVFSDYSNFILIDDVYRDVLRDTVRTETETAVQEVSGRRIAALLLDASDLNVSRYSLLGPSPPPSEPGSPAPTDRGSAPQTTPGPDETSPGPDPPGPESTSPGPDPPGPDPPGPESTSPARPDPPESTSPGPDPPESTSPGPDPTESTSPGPDPPGPESTSPARPDPPESTSPGPDPPGPESTSPGPDPPGPESTSPARPDPPESTSPGPDPTESTSQGPDPTESTSQGPDPPESSSPGPDPTESTSQGPDPPESSSPGPDPAGPDPPGPESTSPGPDPPGPESTSPGPESSSPVPDPPESTSPGPESTSPGPESTSPGPESTSPGPESSSPGPDPPGPESTSPGPESTSPGPDPAGPDPPESTSPGPDPLESTSPGPDPAGPDPAGPSPLDPADPCESSSSRLRPPAPHGPMRLSLGSLSEAIGCSSPDPPPPQTTDRAVYLLRGRSLDQVTQDGSQSGGGQPQDQEEIPTSSEDNDTAEETREEGEEEVGSKEEEVGRTDEEEGKEGEVGREEEEVGRKEEEEERSDQEVVRIEEEVERTEVEVERKEEEVGRKEEEEERKEEEVVGTVEEIGRKEEEEERKEEEVVGTVEEIGRKGEEEERNDQQVARKEEEVERTEVEVERKEEEVGRKEEEEERREEEEGRNDQEVVRKEEEVERKEEEEMGSNEEEVGSKEDQEEEEEEEEEEEDDAALPLDSVSVIRALVSEVIEVETIIRPPPQSP